MQHWDLHRVVRISNLAPAPWLSLEIDRLMSRNLDELSQAPRIYIEVLINTVVILSLRGHNDLGRIFLTVLERYADDLHEHNSKLMRAGVTPVVVEQLEKTGLIKRMGRENILLASEQIGQSATASR